MRLQLKNVKILESLSEETLCYSATVYVDGARTVEVSNHGHGGPDMQHRVQGSKLSVAEVNDWCKTNLPRIHADYFDGGLEQDLEMWCHAEAERIDDERRVKSALSRNIIARTKTGECWQWTRKKKGQDRTVQIREYISKKYPGATIVNDLPFAEACRIIASGGAVS